MCLGTPFLTILLRTPFRAKTGITVFLSHHLTSANASILITKKKSFRLFHFFGRSVICVHSSSLSPLWTIPVGPNEVQNEHYFSLFLDSLHHLKERTNTSIFKLILKLELKLQCFCWLYLR
jgi:hypothetical protein